MISDIPIGDRKIGFDHPCFIIEEAGVNHDGDISKAKKLIDIAVDAKADAVKFQMFSGEKLASKDAMLANYHKKGALAEKETLKELLRRLELSTDEFFELFHYAKQRGALLFATPFDTESVDLLSEMGVPLFKIASFSLTNYPLLRSVARKKLPIIMSTGLHTLGEIEKAVDIILGEGNDSLVLLQCTSHYPSEPRDANLRVMDTLKAAFNAHVGYSDHTMGIAVALGAVAMGAKVIEKHFTLDTSAFGVDHDASISPQELASLVKGVRDIEAAMGTSVKVIPKIEEEIQRVHRPSLVAMVDIPAGRVIAAEMLGIKKPGTGIHPADMDWVVGRRARVPIEADRLIKREYLEG